MDDEEALLLAIEMSKLSTRQRATYPGEEGGPCTELSLSLSVRARATKLDVVLKSVGDSVLSGRPCRHGASVWIWSVTYCEFARDVHTDT